MSAPIIIDEEIVAVVGFANKENVYDNNDVSQVIAFMNGVWNAKERREALETTLCILLKHWIVNKLRTLPSINSILRNS